ncbi:MAG: TCR/Tet family MFS transporter [Myxococcales bacterium]|nr:TCR/Tet family MFS transporter [Myxococcales bacterium]
MTEPKPVRTASVALVLLVIFLDTLGIGVIIPVLPRLVASFVGGDLAAGSRWYGVLSATYSSMQFMFAPAIGALSDRFGRRTVILGSLAGAATNYVLTIFAPSLAWLFVGRVIAGVSGASFSAATAYIADVTPPEKRAQNFGLVGAMFGLGFIVGPAVGGLLGRIDLRAPFALAALLNAANFAYGVFVLPESLPKERRRAFSFKRANPVGALLGLRRNPVLLGLSGTIVLSYLSQSILQSVWALHTQNRFGWSTLDVGLSLTAVGVAAATVQGGMVRPTVRRFGERRTMIFALTCSGLGFVGFGVAWQAWALYAIILPFALGGLAGPATQAILTRAVDPSEQGELQGTLASLQSATYVLGPLISTRLFARFSTAGSQPYVPGAAFFAAAILTFTGLLLALRLFARQRSIDPTLTA